MKTHQSKRELYLDNCKMKKEIDNLLAANAELVILNDQANSDIEEVNKKIVEFNKRILE